MRCTTDNPCRLAMLFAFLCSFCQSWHLIGHVYVDRRMASRFMLMVVVCWTHQTHTFRYMNCLGRFQFSFWDCGQVDIIVALLSGVKLQYHNFQRTNFLGHSSTSMEYDLAQLVNNNCPFNCKITCNVICKLFSDDVLTLWGFIYVERRWWRGLGKCFLKMPSLP